MHLSDGFSESSANYRTSVITLLKVHAHSQVKEKNKKPKNLLVNVCQVLPKGNKKKANKLGCGWKRAGVNCRRACWCELYAFNLGLAYGHHPNG